MVKVSLSKLAPPWLLQVTGDAFAVAQRGPSLGLYEFFLLLKLEFDRRHFSRQLALSYLILWFLRHAILHSTLSAIRSIPNLKSDKCSLARSSLTEATFCFLCCNRFVSCFNLRSWCSWFQSISYMSSKKGQPILSLLPFSRSLQHDPQWYGSPCLF